MFPSAGVPPVVSGHALGCFCHSYGRFLGIILLPAAYHTLLRAQECSSCSAGIIVSPAAAGFPFPARAGGSRLSHIPSSPHQRHGPEGRQRRLPAPQPSQKTAFPGVQGDPAWLWLWVLGWALLGSELSTSGLQDRCGALLCSLLHSPAAPSLLSPAFL